MKNTRFFMIGIVFMAFMVAAAPARPAFSRLELYYFNPDSLQSNLSRLKAEMDTLFLRAEIPISFQAFARLTDFDRNIREKQPAYMFLPSWYFSLNKDQLDIHPFLLPLRRGENHYSKILLVAKNSGLTLKNITKHTLAMTSIGPQKEDILNSILFKELGIDAADLNTIIVPKDTDALFALSLGQVDMALVVKDNLDSIGKINPRITQAVKPIAETKPIPMPIFCFYREKASKDDVEAFKNVFVQSTHKGIRHNMMEMLNIDEWQAIP